MGYCSDCYIYNHCPWFCGNYDIETEQPIQPCFSKEYMLKEIGDPVEDDEKILD